MSPFVVLASQSPRRKELFHKLGIPFTVLPASIDETPRAGESPENFVARAAREKGVHVASKVSRSIVLSADTIVTIDGEILGKPADESDAFLKLRKLSGKCHSVYTAVCVINQNSEQMLEGIDETKVWFDTLSDAQIQDYLRRENVLDKAGAYAIQGYAAVFIPRIEGNYTNVMGLPLPLVHRLICRTLS